MLLWKGEEVVVRRSSVIGGASEMEMSWSESGSVACTGGDKGGDCTVVLSD